MSFGGHAPAPPAPPPPPANPPTLANPQAQLSGDSAARAAAAQAGAGFADTIKTSPQGAPTAPSAKTTLGA